MSPGDVSPRPQARTAVGRWLNVVRNTQRMLLSWTPASEAHLVREFARWNAVLTPAACAYLCRRQRWVGGWVGGWVVGGQGDWHGAA